MLAPAGNVIRGEREIRFSLPTHGQFEKRGVDLDVPETDVNTRGNAGS